jgi:hypothetical protein
MKTRFIAALALFLVVGVHMAGAHAFPDHADPKVGSRVSASPPRVEIWFTQKLVAALSDLKVFDETGKEVDKRDKKLDAADPALLTVSIPALKPGKYKVVWRAVSVDTHVANGKFTFEVAP